jgi:hypothetical protein
MMAHGVQRGLDVVVGLDLLHDARAVGADGVEAQRQGRDDVGE